MKKFLTVLLALSVVFTYSFSAVGSAFAASAADETANLKEAVSTYASKIVYDQTGKLVQAPALGAPDTNLTQAAVEATVAKIIEDYTKKIEAAEALALADGEITDAEKADIAAAWQNDLGSDNQIKTAIFWDGGEYAKEDGVLYTKAVADAKAGLTAKINAVVADNYADPDAVKTIVADAQKAVTDAKNSKAGLKAIVDATTAFDTSMKDQPTTAQQAEALAKAKTDAKKTVSDAAAKYLTDRNAALEKIVTNEDYTYTPQQVSEAAAELAVLAANVAKVEALYNGRIDAVEITDEVNLTAAQAEINKQVSLATGYAFANPTNFADVINQFADVDLLVKYATELANGMKNEYDVNTGLAKYNAATVDSKLEEVVKKINSLDGSANDYNKVKNLMDAVPTAVQEAAALKTAKETAVKSITEGTYASTNWDGDNKVAVEAIQKEYTDVINAATAKADIDAAVKAAKEKMDALLTTAQKTTQSNKAAAEAAKYRADLTKYANGIAAKTPNTYSDATIAKAVEAAEKAMVDAVIAKNDPKLTDAEIAKIVKDNYPTALAVIDGMKSTDELKAAAQAVESAIQALTSPADLTKKADYVAAKKMLDNYVATPGASENDISKASRDYLDALLTSIQNQEKAAVEKAINDLPKNPTKDDEAAVKAAREAYDAFKAEYTDDDISAAVAQKLKNAEEKVSDAKLVDAAKKIAALPASITSADKEAVEAARAAYDALTDAEKAKFSKPLLEKLESAEIQLDSANIAAIKGTHMKIYSSAAKGYIKISWKASNTDVALDGVEVYRSTKKTSGFKKISTFKVQTSKKYSTNLKKGTKYYYYVKGYKMVGDEKVYTHNSITVGRTFRK